MIHANIFRAYDVRGIVGETLTHDTVTLLGQSIGSAVKRQGEKTVIVGRDGRISSPSLAKALHEGLMASGCDVIDIGAVPTPLLYFATHILSTRSGVMITGSHNPSNYNGFKIVIAGKTLKGEDIQQLYQAIVTQDFTQGAGTLQTKDVIESYVQKFNTDIHLNRPLKVVIDCGHGITGMLAPRLFKNLGCEVIELFCNVDGHFPAHHPDPSRIENLRDLIEVVITKQADIGIAFDGDGDRLGVVSKTGEIIWPDRLMMLFAQSILKKHRHASVVFDVKCSRHLAKIIQQASGKPVMWKTGHSFIKAKMSEINALLAGEMSGHLYFADRWYGFDDALYAAARLVEIISHTSTAKNPFSDLPNSVNTPEITIEVSEEEKFSFIEQFQNMATFPGASDINRMDGLRVEYDDGWGLLRASNTTPALVLRFEADTPEALMRIQSTFRSQLAATNPTLQLKF